MRAFYLTDWEYRAVVRIWVKEAAREAVRRYAWVKSLEGSSMNAKPI